MIEQQARVVRADEGTAWVSLGGQSGCVSCDAGKGCGAGVFGRLLRRRPVELPLPNRIGVSVGQAVTLSLPESLYLRMVVSLYGWPLLAGLAGAILGHRAGSIQDESAAVLDLFALAGLIIGAAVAFRFSRRKGLSFSAANIGLEAVKSQCLARTGAKFDD